MKTNKRSKIAILSIVFVFLLTTLFGLNFFVPKSVKAESGNGVLKFKQLAVGEDFVIALSYDNELYGFSLSENAKDYTLGSEGGTLGQYYPKNPIKISSFHKRNKDGKIISDGETLGNDYIVKIAATRTTAALITNDGYIYTWGYDKSDEPSNGGLRIKGLLLNVDFTSTNAQSTPDGLYEPTIIKDNLIRNGTYDSSADKAVDIVGNGDNYVAIIQARAGAEDKRYMAWGNGLFNQISYPSGSSTSSTDKLSTAALSVGSYSEFYLGQGFIVARNGNNIAIQGKNFFLPSGKKYIANNDIIELGSFSATQTDGHQLGIGKFYLTKQATDGSSTTKTVHTVNNAYVNSFASFESVSNLNDYSANFVYGDGTAVASVSSPSLSFGSGYGYYVSSDGKVYFIGSTVNGQGAKEYSNGDADYNDQTGFLSEWKEISGLSSINQVVAGNVSSGSGANGNNPFIFKGGVNNDAAAVGSVQSTNYVEFDSKYYDGDEYISAAVAENGTVYAWNKDSTPVAVEFENFEQNDNNKIISLTAGYNNNLFALSNLGNIYRITAEYSESSFSKFVGKAINDFSDGNGSIRQWDVNNKLSVNFKGGADSSYDKTTNKAQISVKVNYSYDQTAEPDIATVAEQEKDYVEIGGGANFVPQADNLSRDAYRIIISSSLNSGLTIPTEFNGDKDKDIHPAADITATQEFPVGAIRFYSRNGSRDTLLDYEVVKNFIDFEIVVSGGETYFLITPKKSTKQNDIVVKFWIGRFDNAANKAPDVAANFYDCRPTEITLSIENTTAQFTEFDNHKDNEGYQDEAPGSPRMSKIPVLDVNNKYNKSYSIALMNVSEGFKQIAEKIAELSDAIDVKVKKDIIDNITHNDGGFPAVSRIDNGNLVYYLGEKMARHYYNDSYKYFASDRDGDRIQVGGTIEEPGSNKNEKGSVGKQAIRIEIDLSGYGNLDYVSLRKFINTGDEYSEVFNNLYGFYNIELNEGKQTLTVIYDVITITAKASTGSVTYSGSSQSVSASTLAFTDDAGNGGDSFSFILQENADDYSNLLTNYFHVQSTLRMSDKFTTEDGDPIYGQAGKNEYRYTYSDGSTTSIRVGTVQNKNIEIKISDFFDDVSEASGIKFAYNGRTGDTAFREFESTFNPLIMDATLSADTFTFTPKEAGTSEIKLSAGRFYGTANFGDAETIDIYVTVIAVPQNFKRRDDVSSVTMNSRTYSLVATDRFVLDDPSIAEIEYVNVTDNSVVRVSYTDSAATFTARKSGVVNVSFTVRVYNTVLTDSFSLIVEDIAQMDNVYAVSNTKNIYIDDVERFLRAANASSNIPEDLVLDRENETDDSQGFYFQQYLISEDGGSEWTEVPLTDLPYISSARIRTDTTGQHLRLELRSVGSQDILNPTRVVMNFRSESSGKVYSAAAQFAPANQLIQNDDKSPFIFEIEYGKDFENQDTETISPSRTDGNTVLLPLRYLTAMMPNSVDYEKATISFVSAQTGYEEFFALDRTTTAAGDCISITPLYPTKTLDNDYVTVNVSIRDDSGTGYLLSFYVRITGIRIDLDKNEYGDILLIAFLCSFGFLFIIFIIRMGIYWKRKADQRRIIRKNQMLIKMRDKMHNNKTAAPREQIVKTKMKMDDPKYAKMFEQMRAKKEAETGISLENSAVAKKAKQKTKAAEKNSAKGKKGKKGKKSIEELKAELEAKKMAFAQMQMDGNVSSVGGDMSDGMDMNMTEPPIFENVEGFADAEVQPEFDADFIDPDSIRIDDLGDN